MAHTLYDNFFLSNEVEDQFNSHLDLQQFCTIDNSLVGTAGMKKIINVYSATNGTEKLTLGQGNTKSIEVSYTPKEYEILLAQNRFVYQDEQAMQDPMLIPVGMKHAGTDMFNTINDDIYAEFKKTSLVVEDVTAPNFEAFVDAAALFDMENLPDANLFAFVCSKDMAKIRKALKDDLKYVESFSRLGYVGTVAGINLYTKKDATEGEIIVGTKGAVTLLNKLGVEIEQVGKHQRGNEEANTRTSVIYSRKYYVAVLTDETKAVKIPIA